MSITSFRTYPQVSFESENGGLLITIYYDSIGSKSDWDESPNYRVSNVSIVFNPYIVNVFDEFLLLGAKVLSHTEVQKLLYEAQKTTQSDLDKGKLKRFNKEDLRRKPR